MHPKHFTIRSDTAIAPGYVARAIACTLLAAASASLAAQSAGLEPLVVTSTRVEKPVDEIPAAVSVVGQDEIQLGSEQLGLDESLDAVPGVFFQNRYNFAQDLRASIRGFGARSSFGIRGIRIVVDGIPETLPDGQGSVDGIDLGSASRISVIRGPASSLYGNASGGAILIESERGPVKPFVALRQTLGEFDLRQTQLKTGGEHGSLNYLVNLSDTSLGGYREHSEFENKQINGRFEYALPGDSSLLLSLHHTDQPIAEDPGGITATEADDDPRQARDLNVAYDAGEELEQTRIGVLYKTMLAHGDSLEARIYRSDRDFRNRLPFAAGGAVDLERSFVGGGATYIKRGKIGDRHNRLLLGFDYDLQDDDRRRFDNLLGELGALAFDQREQVTASGLFVQNETGLTDRLELTVGLRRDRVEFDVDDDFLADGDDSGRIRFDQTSPMIGISYARSAQMRLYATISTAFETPTTTELANPAGGGFNPDLDAQQSTNYEVGLKVDAERTRYEIALFHIDVDDELTPFELPAAPGRTFYENAGQSTRDGLEFAWTRQLGRGLELSTSYTWSDFTFERFTDAGGDVYDGNRIPGIPRQLLRFGVSWFDGSGFHVDGKVAYNGAFFADNANEVEIDAATVADLRLGYDRFWQNWDFSAFAGINNLFDEDYFNNIRINAFGGRYYEPAAGRNAFIGVSLRRGLDG